MGRHLTRRLLLVVGGSLWGLPWAWAVACRPWSPLGPWALWAVLGSYIPVQAKDLATLVDALHAAHLQRHGGVVTLVGPQLGVTDMPLSPVAVVPTWLAHLVHIWNPIMHWPAFMVVSPKFCSHFPEYLMPISTPLCSPFVLTFPARARRNTCACVMFPLSQTGHWPQTGLWSSS